MIKISYDKNVSHYYETQPMKGFQSHSTIGL